MAMRNWNVKNGLRQLHGMEHAVRLLLNQLFLEILEYRSYGSADRRIEGIAIATTVQCAQFCEFTMKTLHAQLSDGQCEHGHILASPTPKDPPQLYEHLEERYRVVTMAALRVCAWGRPVRVRAA